MTLQIGFDEELMRQYAARGASPIFDIHWSCDGETYPSHDWIDFGAVILGWWIVAGERLLRGSKEERFLFMDGPYELRARRQDSSLQISATYQPLLWTVPLQELMVELIRAADTVSQELLRLGIAEQDRRSLDYGVGLLRSLLDSGRL